MSNFQISNFHVPKFHISEFHVSKVHISKFYYEISDISKFLVKIFNFKFLYFKNS